MAVITFAARKSVNIIVCCKSVNVITATDICTHSMGSLTLLLQYRRITLLTTVYGFYAAVLSNRITVFMKYNFLYPDEQNGSREKGFYTLSNESHTWLIQKA